MLKRIIQLIIVTVPVTLFAWLLLIDISPSGELSVRHEVDQRSPYIDNLLPAERVMEIQYNDEGDPYVSIIDDPVYLSLHLPETEFEEVEVEIEFNNRLLPIVEFGPLVDIFSNGFDLRPAQNLIIDNSRWERLEANGLTLLQRNSDFASISNFFDSLPDVSRIATYAYDLKVPFVPDNYVPLEAPQEVNVSLRGFHKYLTFIEDETFYLEASLMDMNRTTGADDVVVTVRNQDGDVVIEESLVDDGNTIENQISSARKITLKKDGLATGVYEVELRGTSDIFWRKLVSTQRYMTFVNQIYIGDDVGFLADEKGTGFVTNAKQFTFETYHADATQRIQLGSGSVAIPRSHEKINAKVSEPGVVEAFIPGGDIKINGDGKFAFTADAFFDPEPVSLQASTDLDLRSIDYILSGYESPVHVDGWQVVSHTFNIVNIVDEQNNVRLVFSTPEINTLQGELQLHAVNLTLKKEPLTVRNFFKELRERLPFGL